MIQQFPGSLSLLVMIADTDDHQGFSNCLTNCLPVVQRRIGILKYLLDGAALPPQLFAPERRKVNAIQQNGS